MICIDDIEFDDLKEYKVFSKYNTYYEIGKKQYKINIKKNFGAFWDRFTDDERHKIFIYLELSSMFYCHDFHFGKMAFVSMEKVKEVLTTGQFKGGRGKLWRKTKYILRWDGLALPNNRKDLNL